MWRVNANLEVSVAGQNLFDPAHPEFGTENEIERSWYARVAWRY